MALIYQYASSVISYSSQWSSLDNSASQALGASDVASYGGSPLAWAPSSMNGTIETLTLGFSTPVYLSNLWIYENYGNGFVTNVELLSTDNIYNQWWSGFDNASVGIASAFNIYEIAGQTNYLVKGVRITVDTNHTADWEEIDAIQISGYTITDDFVANMATTGYVSVGYPSTGNIETGGDSDWFYVYLTANKQYQFDLKGSPTGDGTLSDPALQLMNPSGVLVTSDDDSGTGFNSQILYTVPSSGYYYLAAAGSTTSGTGTYTVAVTDVTQVTDDFSASTSTLGFVNVGSAGTGNIETAGDSDWFYVYLTANKQYQFDLKGSPTSEGTLADPNLQLMNASGILVTSDDDSGAGFNSQILYTVSSSGYYYLAATSHDTSATGTYTVAVTDVTPVIDDFSANTVTTGSVAIGSASTGNLETVGDNDWFKVYLTANNQYQFDLKGSSTSEGTLSDPDLQLMDSSGAFITSDGDSGTGYNSLISYTAPSSGYYYLGATSYAAGATGTYTLAATAVTTDDYLANTSTTGSVSVGYSSTGNVETGGDNDWFYVYLTANKQYQFDLKGSPTSEGTLSDPVLQLMNSSGTLITSDDDSGTGYNALILYTASSSGYYYLGAAGNSANATGTYTLAVTEAGNNLPTGDVTITGTSQQGQILTAANTLADADGLGTVSYQWQANGVSITGATANTYTLTQAEVGKTITVVAGYTDLRGTAETKTSSATSAVANVNDLPTGAVTITGTVSQGQTLTAGNTLADADGLGTISYQWQANGAAITGATANTYTLTQAQVGKTITVVAKYTDALGTAESKTSSATSAVANVNDLPTGTVSITGTARQGQTLTAGNTLADVDGLGSISYQWRANGAAITGASARTYTLTQAEVGKTITVLAAYTDQLGAAESKASSATSAVANINDLPTGAVTITGTATQGQTLTVGNTLADADGLGTISYQWRANGAAIAGATANSYTLTQAQVGKTITVLAAYTDLLGAAESKASSATTAVANVNDLPSGEVTITGTLKQGQTLTVANTLADADGLGVIHYQWQANGVAISGATADTYTLTLAEVGKTISAVAGYTDLLGTAESVSSASTSSVVPNKPSFIITKNDLSTNEDGDIAKISVQLATAPTRDVSITFTSSDLTEGTVTNPTLTFNSSNWSKAQTFTVTGQNDYLNDGNQPYFINAAVTSSDVNYRQIPIDPIVITNGEDVTAADDARIPQGTARDVPIKLYGDTQVDTSVIVDGFFKPISSFNDNDQLHGLDGKDTLYGGNLQDDLSGGIGNDLLYGGNDEDFLYGEDGNDVLYGEQDADHLEGGAGNDTLDGGLAIDTMIGGDGNDTYYLGYENDVIDDQGLPADVDTVIMPYNLKSYALPKGIENGAIDAGTQASNLSGNTSNNGLKGNDGNNVLSGLVGRDSLFGGSGSDILIGGTDNDTLSGGAGKDIFKFNAPLANNTDKITDFKVVDDTIQLDNAFFVKLTKTGVLTTANFVKGGSAHDANDYIIYNPTSGAVTYDADGSGAGAGVQVVLLGVNLLLTNADFVVI